MTYFFQYLGRQIIWNKLRIGKSKIVTNVLCGRCLGNRLKNSYFPYFFYVSERWMAGHSKWQNIRHTKAAKDAQKSKIINRVTYNIKKAVIESGPNPKSNIKLKQCLEEAKKYNIPNATIERALKKAQNAKIQSKILEIAGPEGSLFIVNIESDNITYTVHEVRSICKKIKVAIVPEGRAKSMFDRKGVITVTETKDNSPLDSTKALDIAIEAGAEDVQTSEDDGKIVLKFYSDPNEIYQVKKYLESTQYLIENTEIIYKPRVRVSLTDSALELAEKLYNGLEELLDDNVVIYDNIE